MSNWTRASKSTLCHLAAIQQIFTYDKDGLRFYSDLTQEFELTAQDSFKTIEFLVKKLVFAPVSVAFDQAVPKNTQVVLKNNMAMPIHFQQNCLASMPLEDP